MTNTLPIYKCHKEVKAFKIRIVRMDKAEGVVRILSDNLEYTAAVPIKTFEKHSPLSGWYYVEYADGHQSFSPPEAFENGYSRKKSAEVFNWKEYESKPTIRKAFQITSAHEIHWFEDTKSLNITDAYGSTMITAACHQKPEIGDYIVYLNDSDIYHCSEKVFLERNVVPGR